MHARRCALWTKELIKERFECVLPPSFECPSLAFNLVGDDSMQSVAVERRRCTSQGNSGHVQTRNLVPITAITGTAMEGHAQREIVRTTLICMSWIIVCFTLYSRMLIAVHSRLR